MVFSWKFHQFQFNIENSDEHFLCEYLSNNKFISLHARRLFLKGFNLDLKRQSWACVPVRREEEWVKKSNKPRTQSITLVFSSDKQSRAPSAMFVFIVFVTFVLKNLPVWFQSQCNVIHVLYIVVSYVEHSEGLQWLSLSSGESPGERGLQLIYSLFDPIRPMSTFVSTALGNVCVYIYIYIYMYVCVFLCIAER